MDACRLLETLCVRLGFCPSAQQREEIASRPPPTVDAFTNAVIIAEGLDPVLIDSTLRRRVRETVAAAFDAEPLPEPAARSNREPASVRRRGSQAARPVLFLDIDGVLIPFGSSDTPVYADPAHGDRVNPLLSRINPELGRILCDLPYDLYWASSWSDDANEVISPLLGMPVLPVVAWVADDPPRGVHWKTPDLLRAAGGRPFAWLDDEITTLDRQYVAMHHAAPTLLLRSDPAIGVSDAELGELRRWRPNRPLPRAT